MATVVSSTSLAPVVGRIRSRHVTNGRESLVRSLMGEALFSAGGAWDKRRVGSTPTSRGDMATEEILPETLWARSSSRTAAIDGGTLDWLG